MKINNKNQCKDNANQVEWKIKANITIFYLRVHDAAFHTNHVVKSGILPYERASFARRKTAHCKPIDNQQVRGHITNHAQITAL